MDRHPGWGDSAAAGNGGGDGMPLPHEPSAPAQFPAAGPHANPLQQQALPYHQGAPIPYGGPCAAPYGGFGAPTGSGRGMQVAGLCCGIGALVLFILPFFSWVLGPLGIIFGGIGIAQAGRVGSSKGMGIAGIVCGSLGLAGWLLLIISVIASCGDSGC